MADPSTSDVNSIAVPLFSNPNYSETSKLVYSDVLPHSTAVVDLKHFTFRVGDL